MADKKRYTVTINMYIDAENDYMARKKAHSVKNGIQNYLYNDIEDLDISDTKVIGITETPYASLQTRELKDISEPGERLDGLFGEIELPF